MLLNKSSLFFWNILPTGVDLDGSHIYLYLLYGQEHIVKYDDFYPVLAYDSLNLLQLF